jgi:hypothetical protein
MAAQTDVLFQPFVIGKVSLKNRVALAPTSEGVGRLIRKSRDRAGGSPGPGRPAGRLCDRKHCSEQLPDLSQLISLLYLIRNVTLYCVMP